MKNVPYKMVGAVVVIVFAGLLVRALGIPGYSADSMDEWGNTIVPLRMIYEGGHPGHFIHPSLFYNITALVYILVFSAAKAAGIVAGGMSMTDLFIVDERYFFFSGRALSSLFGAMGVYACYLLGRQVWGRSAGLAAAVLAVFLPLHVYYSRTVRVDTLFVFLFLCSAYHILRMYMDRDDRSYMLAGVFVGLATSANYNGFILVAWMAAAHFTNVKRLAGEGDKNPTVSFSILLNSLLLSIVSFFLSSPFILLDFKSFLEDFVFQFRLSSHVHPGVEGRGLLFYAGVLLEQNIIYFIMAAFASVYIMLRGKGGERFFVSIPLGYLAVFTIISTKYDRFILPVAMLLCVCAAGLIVETGRKPSTRRFGPAVLTVLCALAAAGMFMGGMDALSRPGEKDENLLEWIGDNVARGSTILIESDIIPLVDTIQEPGRFADNLRISFNKEYPEYDYNFMEAVYVGGLMNYDTGLIVRGDADYFVLSMKNIGYIKQSGSRHPEVLDFYEALEQNTSEIYRVRVRDDTAIIYKKNIDSDDS